MIEVTEVRRVPTAALVVTLAIAVGALVAFWLVPPVANALGAVAAWSDGLLQPTLLINVAQLVVFVIVWFGVFRLRPDDVGLQAERLSGGLLVLVGGWLVIQLIRVIAAVVVGHGIESSDASGQARWLLGSFIAQVVGNALVEEVVHRGLILRQLFLRIGPGSERGRLVAATVVGSVLFALTHILMLVYRGYAGNEVAGGLVGIAAMGCFFAAIYVRTGNLFVAIAVHALFNVSGDIVASPIDGRALAGALGFACIVWPRLARPR